MKRPYFILILVGAAIGAHFLTVQAQSAPTGPTLDPFKVTATSTITPRVATNVFQLPVLANGASDCLYADASGTIHLASGACGSGTGGSGSGTVSRVSPGFGITISPNPLTTTGTVSVTTSSILQLFSVLNCLTYNSSTGQLGSTCITTSTNNFGGLTGNGLANQIPVYTASGTFAGFVGLTYASSSEQVSVGGNVIVGVDSSGSGNNALKLFDPGSNHYINLLNFASNPFADINLKFGGSDGVVVVEPVSGIAPNSIIYNSDKWSIAGLVSSTVPGYVLTATTTAPFFYWAQATGGSGGSATTTINGASQQFTFTPVFSGSTFTIGTSTSGGSSTITFTIPNVLSAYVNDSGYVTSTAGSAPGGNNSTLQYNNNGSFAGFANLTINTTTGQFKMSGSAGDAPGSSITVGGQNLATTATDTEALLVYDGGVIHNNANTFYVNCPTAGSIQGCSTIASAATSSSALNIRGTGEFSKAILKIDGLTTSVQGDANGSGLAIDTAETNSSTRQWINLSATHGDNANFITATNSGTSEFAISSSGIYRFFNITGAPFLGTDSNGFTQGVTTSTLKTYTDTFGYLTTAVQSLSNNSASGGIDFSASTGSGITGVLHSLAITQFTGVLPLANGGTNATSAAAALANLGGISSAPATSTLIAGGTATGPAITIATATMPYFSVNCTGSTCTFTGAATSTLGLPTSTPANLTQLIDGASHNGTANTSARSDSAPGFAATVNATSSAFNLGTSTISTNLQTQTLNEPVVTSTATTSSTNINWALSSIQALQLQTSTALTFTGCTNGQKPTLYVYQDGTGSRVINSWPSSGSCQVAFMNGMGAPTLPTAINTNFPVSFQCTNTGFVTSTLVCRGQYVSSTPSLYYAL